MEQEDSDNPISRKRPNGHVPDRNKDSFEISSDSNSSISSDSDWSSSSVTSEDDPDRDMQLPTNKPKNPVQRPILSFQKHLLENKTPGDDNDMKILYTRNRETTIYFDFYNFNSNVSTPLYQVRKPRDASSIVMVEDALYHIGGSKPNREDGATRKVEIYRPSCKEGLQAPTLGAAAKNAATCTLNNSIYVIGGERLFAHGQSTHKWTQRLDLCKSRPKWVRKRDMHHLRDSFDVAVLGNKIFAAGGYGSAFHSQTESWPLETFEYYTPETDKWTLLKSNRLKARRAHHKLCTLDNKLYAVGGYDYKVLPLSDTSDRANNPKVFFNTVEIFDPNDGGRGWNFVAKMNDERHSGAVFAKNGLLYAIGGNLGAEPTAEFYDHRINEWQYLTWPSELPNPKENMVDYSSAIEVF